MTARIQRDLEDLRRSPIQFCTAGPTGFNRSIWEAKIKGPRGTPYAGGTFRLSIVFPTDYPSSPPQVKFLTRIYHMNVHDEGKICLDILKERWRSSYTIRHALLAIQALLNKPNPDDPFDYVKANVYKQSRFAYWQKAQEMTRVYAMQI